MSFTGVRVLAIAWMGMVFFLSAMTASELEGPSLAFRLPDWFDKPVHAFLYAGLVLCFAPPPSCRSAPSEWLPFAVAASMTFALTDEIHQMLVPGRSPEALDLLADVTGIAFSALVSGARWLAPLRRRIFTS